MSLLVLAHAVSTWFMVGLIWTIQSVHYPLFIHVGSDAFSNYEQAHTQRMVSLLALPAGLEIITGAALAIARPEGVDGALIWAAGALLVAIWLMTLVIQVPLHSRLAEGLEAALVRRLVDSNRWRTLAWSIRGFLVAFMVAT